MKKLHMYLCWAVAQVIVYFALTDSFNNEDMQALKWPCLIGGALISVVAIEIIYYFKNKEDKGKVVK